MSRNTFINTVLFFFFYERFRILLFNQILIDFILFQDVLWNFYFNEIDCLSEVESSRTHFEVFGLGLEASSPRKLPCPRLEDSTIFDLLKFRWKAPETLRKICRPFFWFPQEEFA